MSALRKLLATPSSALGTQLRYGLVGVRAALEAALAEASDDDPGADACAQCLVELAGLTEGAHHAKRPVVASAAASLLERGDVPKWLRNLDAGSPPDQVWRRAHLAALRMPPTVANQWRETVGAALGTPASGPWTVLPAAEDTVLVPPFDGAPGWRTAPDGSSDPEITGRLEAPGQPSDLVRTELAGYATVAVALSELDADLRMAVESVQFRGVAAFDDVTRKAFRRDLLDRLGTYGRTRQGTPEAFAALVLVDEALHSVLHLPVSAPGSWWARQQERSRALVFSVGRSHDGVEVHLLARTYREAKARTGGNDVRIPLDGSGAVLACLRLWARVNGKELPGRVAYAG